MRDSNSSEYTEETCCSLQSQYFQIEWNCTKGTHVKAIQRLKPSTELWREFPCSVIILDECHTYICHYCWCILKCPKAPDAPVPLKCMECTFSSYCSEICKLNDAENHELVCSLIGFRALKIAARASVTVNRVRLLIKCLAVRYLSIHSSSSSGKSFEEKAISKNDLSFNSNQFIVIRPTFTDAFQLESNQDHFSLEWKDCLRKAATLLLSICPKRLKVLSLDDLIKVACISDTNSFGITLEWPPPPFSKSQNILDRSSFIALFVAGMGLFPMCSKLNHSCYPSCEYSLKTKPFCEPFLSMRMIRMVDSDQEMTNSYVDLYTDRLRRRSELFKTKNFMCTCDRCLQPLSKSMDRYIQGLLCSQCIRKRLFPTTTTGLMYNDMFFEIGTYLINDLAISLPLMECAKEIVQDFANLDFWWFHDQPDALESGTDYYHRCQFISDQKKDENSNSKKEEFQNGQVVKPSNFIRFYDPSFLPVLLPPPIDTENQSDENLTLYFAECGKYPMHLTNKLWKCERCLTHIDNDTLEIEVEKAEVLQKRIAETASTVTEFSSNDIKNNITKLRRQTGLFFKLYLNYLFHPFHQIIYRMSQTLIDTTQILMSTEFQEEDELSERQFHQLLVDVLLLRHQIACQSVVLPPYHEEKYLTLKVLVQIFTILYLQFPKDIKNSHLLPSQQSILASLNNCQFLYQITKNVLAK